MAKDRTFIEQARRAQIVAGAIEIIAGEGYAAASLNRVATHIGVSKGVISYHFDGKDDLMQTVVETIFHEVGEAMRSGIPLGDSVPGILRAYLRENIGWFRDNRRKGLVLRDILVNFRPKESAVPNDIWDRDAVAILERLLIQGQADGTIREGDPFLMGLAIRRCIDGVVDAWSYHPSAPIDEWLTTLTELVERMVVKQ